MAAITAALALSFVAGVESASLNPSAAAERGSAEILTADFIKMAPFDYFPDHYQNQGKEIEPLPPQF
jgi:hypothetical protein